MSVLTTFPFLGLTKENQINKNANHTVISSYSMYSVSYSFEMLIRIIKNFINNFLKPFSS